MLRDLGVLDDGRIATRKMFNRVYDEDGKLGNTKDDRSEILVYVTGYQEDLNMERLANEIMTAKTAKTLKDFKEGNLDFTISTVRSH